MSKIVFENIAGGFNLAAISRNFDKIKTLIENNILFRNNIPGEPNTVETSLDMNGNRLFNLPAPSTDLEPARLKDLNDVAAASLEWDAIIGKPLATTSSNGLMSSTDKTKLDGLDLSSALNRANHTGSQAISTVTGLQTALDAKQATLVSAVNLKTVNGTTLLGSGDLTVSGTGTVTTVSVASANGFAGTVADATSTPAITLTTSITGLIKGNGSAIQAATAGTDYTTPSGTENLSGKTFLGYTEAVTAANSGSAYTFSLSASAVFLITLNSNTTFTFPAAVAGKSFVLRTKQDGTGSRTISWPSVTWPGGVAPTPTLSANKGDRYIFTCFDGSTWEGIVVCQNI